MNNLIKEIHDLIQEISDKISSNGQNFDFCGEYHETIDYMNQDFIKEIQEGKYTLEEIRQIASELDKLNNIEFGKWYS